MSKKKILITATLAVALLLAFSFVGCENSTLTGNTTGEPAIGIPADEISWVSWKSDVSEQLKNVSLSKVGETGQTITVTAGGIVGGNITFGNTVEIPPGAVPANTFIEVQVVCVEDKEMCGSGVDFLPNMVFLTDVKITLSWESLDINSLNVGDFEAFYSEDEGITWHQVTNLEIDYDEMKVIIWQNHFTRYAWGLSISADL